MISIRNQEDYLQNNTIQQFEIDDGKKYSFNYPCKNYSVCHPFEITFPPGFYFLDVYGASGTTLFLSGQQYDGGHGGHSSGVFIARKRQKLYLYIGGHSITPMTKSYNGGGSGDNENDGSGGGATDFRTQFGLWNETQSLESRILVAAGGGGGYNMGTFSLNGGSGGGETGERGECSSADNQAPIATQTGCEGGTGRYLNGTFGEGASRIYGAGGGGYWGGGNANYCGGSGGSGYIGKVSTLGKYTANTSTYTNIGQGKASITLISFECLSFVYQRTFHFQSTY